MPEVRFGSYRTGGHGEMWLGRGPALIPPLLIVPPLFEEANRCRALLAEVQRRLADDGIATALIDLPGTGESERALSDIRLADWTAAVADAASACGTRMVAAFRGGALLDQAVGFGHRWRFAPVDGAALIRDLDRAQQVAAKRDGNTAAGTRAGYPLSVTLAAELAALRVADGDRVRTVRLETDAAAADARVPGPPLWRRPEPEQDLALAAALAAELSRWVKTCAA